MIIVPGALWGDVFVDSPGVIGCAYDLGTKVVIEYLRPIPGGVQLARVMSVFEFEEHVLFVRADKNEAGETLVMGQGNDSGRFLAKSLHEGFNTRLLTTYGTHACDLSPTVNGFDYVVQISTTEYYDSKTNSNKPVPVPGTSNGIIQLLDGSPVWADLARASQSEMYYPFNQDNVFVGEGAADPPHLQALEDSEQKNIYNGYAARPRCCYDVVSNVFAVCARGESGVVFHFLSRPLVDITTPPVEPPIEPPIEPPEPPDMACTPVVPGHDVIAASTAALRDFCQNYVAPDTALPEYAGKKPYENDEIHDSGLFLADGLLYFMMSNTGKWAQILMNPDDKRPWDVKRQAADQALQDYMRARVGDTLAQTTPGGTLSGDVNV